MEVNKCTYKLVCMNKYINFLHAYVCVEIYIYLTYLNFLLYMYEYIYNKILYNIWYIPTHIWRLWQHKNCSVMFFAILQIYLYVYMLLYTCKYSEIFAEMYVCSWHFARSFIQAWTLTFTLPDTCTRPRVGSKVSESKGVRECVSFALYIFIYSSACPLNVTHTYIYTWVCKTFSYCIQFSDYPERPFRASLYLYGS